ncbi:PIG-L deacetylase family protein [Parafrankia sp. EUN1f]|uniref:PIG-L deacetylase family protein n=1 Tax=Parafrankia sp. EUN1f TaxID=102897 RepID=UPI0001C43E61|nr:PIG-L deacetylase family protein [Parafrankia sp. EUN1f]EFC85099.1 LmbE family protein [Parafrankia sp. EUN1f]
MADAATFLGRDELLLPFRRGFRWAWARRGVDLTVRMAQTSALVVAPHPDDETLGCGVSILRKREAGRPVHIAVVSDGAAAPRSGISPAELAVIRREEARKAGGRLGVDAKQQHFLDFPDGAISDRVDEVSARLAELLEACQPEQMLIPVSCEGHPDHNASGAAARRAAAMTGYTGQVLEYGVWLWTHWPWTRGYGTEGWSPRRVFGDPVHRVREVRPLLVDARGYRERQLAALAEHVSQTTPDKAGNAPTLPASLLAATTRSPVEIYLEVGALDHLA